MRFSRPVGAVRDVRELEYLVALHQTTHGDVEGFVDGSIDASDVKAFLMSRHGIDVSEEDVREIIFKGFAGGEVEEDACLDLVEIVSILIIPLLVKVNNVLTGKAGDWSEEQDEERKLLRPPPTIVEDVLETILSATLGEVGEATTPKEGVEGAEGAVEAEGAEGAEDDEDETAKAPDDAPKPAVEEVAKEPVVKEVTEEVEAGVTADPPEKRAAPRLTPALLKAILAEHDEIDLLEDDDLVRQMILAATGGKDVDEDAVLDVATFARALTSDVDLYDEGNETRYTTILRDVMGPRGERPADVKTKKTLSQVDFVADNVKAWEHAVLVWLIIVLSYFLYVWGTPGLRYDCGNDSFGCKVAGAIVNWISVMLTLTILGSVVGIGLSFGNGQNQGGLIGPIVGIAAACLFVVFPGFYELDTPIFTSDREAWGAFLGNAIWILPAFGFVLILLQIKNLAGCLVDVDSLPRKLRAFFLGSNGRSEYHSKQAGIYKVNQMVKHAYDLHKSQGKENIEAVKDSHTLQNRKKKSTRERAYQNYSDSIDETEPIGGAFWAYKSFLTGSLQRTEGIWLSSRFMAAIVIMFVTVLLIFGGTIYLFNGLVQVLYPATTVQYSDTCFSTFDYDNCYFPWGQGLYSGTAICRHIELKGEGCIELFEEIPTGSEYQSKGCELLDQAYEIVSSATLGNLTCTEVFGSVNNILDQSDYYDVQYFDGCKVVADANEERLAELMALDPTLDETGIEYCRNLTAFVYSEMEKSLFDQPTDSTNSAPDGVGEAVSLLENFTSIALDFCIDLYGTINTQYQSMCNRGLYRALETIPSYERNYTETEFCQSSLSYCTPDPLNPETGTCVIGERYLIPFQFEGPTCRSYPEINNTLTYYDTYVAPSLNQVADLMPARWMVRLAAAIAITVGFIISLMTTLVYIPSAIHTILKFRSGVIPSLKDPKFLGYRTDLQNMAYMIGCMFWGLIINTLFMVVLMSGVTFLLVWQVTRPFLWTLFAQVIGVSVTIVIKMLFCMIFMKMTHAGYYRKKPTSANVFGFALECWYLGLTLAFVLTRFVKFILSTALYVGRIDRPVLADGLLLDMDSLPKIFRQNLLATDAHRHPYIELMGLMYLMKLRHKEDFGSAPGSAWRLLFVDALMPWLKKKRIQDAFVEKDDDEVGKGGVGFLSEVFAGILAVNE